MPARTKAPRWVPTVTLDGTGSTDAGFDALSYFWSLLSQPNGSTAQLDDPALVQLSFALDAPGTYIA